MRDLFLDGLSITQTFEPNAEGQPQLFGELLFFPEITSFGPDEKRIREIQIGIAQSIVENAPPEELQRRELAPNPEAFEIDSISFDLDPPQKDNRPRTPAWTRPVKVTFPYLWHLGAGGAAVAFVPGLGIEVVAADLKKLGDLLEDHIRFALVRSKACFSLFELALLQRSPELTVAAFEWNAYPLTPVERSEREGLGEEKTAKVLSAVATRLNHKPGFEAFERAEDVKRLARLLEGRRATSVLLVGESGVGKTAIVRNLANGPGSIMARNRPIHQTSGSRIVAGMTGLGDWQERCRGIAREAKETKAILYFGNLFELTQVGQSSCSTESIASFFRPHLVRGEFLAIAECTAAQLSVIEQNDPRILDAFRQIRIEPPSEGSTRIILKRSSDRPVVNAFEERAIERILSLHRRYAGYSAFPGRALRFIDRLKEEMRPDSKSPITTVQVDRAFALESGMPDFLIDETKTLDLAETGRWFRERLIGQDESVERVIDAIAAIKARLTRPGKPLASFLFVGPTGVGKTELAKTLAAFFFGSKERLIRLDMSEYSLPGSGSRLVAGGRGDEEGLLTAKMRDQPFSVLLLDEFEKADPSVYDLFLQVLGEARLTDGAGRLADFSNAIIILTSNLGAREYRTTRPGFHNPESAPGAVAIDHFTEAVKKAFRPEFFNRIDRIVPFLPLTRQAVVAVVRRELHLAEQRDGFRNRNLTIDVSDEAITQLAEAGYDPRYGARPVKRALEQRLLHSVAEYIAERPALETGFLVVAELPADQPTKIEFQPGVDSSKENEQDGKRFGKVQELRRLYQRLGESAFVSELHSERNRVRARLKSNREKPGEDLHRRLAEIEALIQRQDRESAAIAEGEEKLLLAMIGDAPASEFSRAIEGAPNRENFDRTLIDFFGAIHRQPEHVLLCFQAESKRRLSEIAGAYAGAAAHFKAKVRIGYWDKNPDEAVREPEENRDPESPPRFRPVAPESAELQEKLIAGPPAVALALAMEIRGEHAAMRFSTEAGLQVFVDAEGNKDRAMIYWFDEEETIEQGYLDEETLLSRNWRNLPVRRQWDAKLGKVRDQHLKANELPGNLPKGFAASSLIQLMEKTVQKNLLEQI